MTVKCINDGAHDCRDYRVYSGPCDQCIESGRDCALSTHGICEICGRIVLD